MKLLGLTGGIGMGKSTASQLLIERDVPVVDTDELAREVVEPGSATLDEVVARFGAQMLGPDGCLRREELAQIVFADTAARKDLEAILHPPIARLWRAKVQQWRAQSRTVAVVVIPLLFETGAEKEMDATMCVACSAATQRRRLLDRGWSSAHIEQRVGAQWAAEKKIALADYLVWTEAGLEVHSQQLERILRTILDTRAAILPQIRSH